MECHCPSGYSGLGIGPSGCLRTTEDPCASHPCIHGACFADVSMGYLCRCGRKFTGKVANTSNWLISYGYLSDSAILGRNCNIRKNPCYPNPCKNGGVCDSISDLSYTCTCTNSYTGDTCETARQCNYLISHFSLPEWSICISMSVLACGGRLRGLEGVLRYPLSNSTFRTLQSCAWIIETNVTTVLNVTFKSFDMGVSTTCTQNWLEVKLYLICGRRFRESIHCSTDS